MDVYKLALAVLHWIRAVKWPEGSAVLRDEGERAAVSAVLNTAEGRTRGGRSGRNHYRIAHASAGEVVAVLDVVALEGGPEAQQKMRRVGAMLNKLR